MSLSNTPTPHIGAEKGEIAETILLPGDPLRAKYIAEHFLEDVKQFNGTRNMLGYTGTYMGRPVSVMGTGMGCPSIGIYSYELIHFYGCKNLIRVGTAGALTPDVHVRDMVFAMGAPVSPAILCACWGCRAIIRRCAATACWSGPWPLPGSGDCPSMWAMCSAQTCSMPRPNRCREE